MNEFIQKLNDYFHDNPIIFYILIAIVAALAIVIILWIAIAIARSKKKTSSTKNSQPESKQTNLSQTETATHHAEIQENSIQNKNETDKTQKGSNEVLYEEEKTAELNTATEPEPDYITDSASQQEPTPASQPLPEQNTTAPSATKITTKKSSTADDDKRPAYNGKWVILQDGDNGYYFELRASNGEKLLSSINYTSVAGAKNGIKTHKNNIQKDNIIISQNKKGQYFFKLLNGSKQLLCTGETYPSKSGCENAVDSVKRFAESAVIIVQKQDDSKE